MTYKTNGEDKIMEKTYKTDIQTKKKLGRQHASGFAIAILLAFGFAMPAQAVVGGGVYPDTSVTILTINIPVRLHQIPPLPDGSYGQYSVNCQAMDMSERLLPSGGSFSENISSGEVNKTVTVAVHPYVGRGTPVTPSQIRGYKCYINLRGLAGTALSPMHAPGTTFRPIVTYHWGVRL